MTKKQAYQKGVESGLKSAAFGDFTKTEQADQDSFLAACSEVCENKRLFAGHPSYDFNREPNAEGLWDAFEAGEWVGIQKGWRIKQRVARCSAHPRYQAKRPPAKKTYEHT